MKKLWIIIVVVLLVAVVGYVERHQLKALISPSSTMMAPTPTVTPATSMQAPTSNIYLTKTDVTKGSYMTDFAGMTLYTFDEDTTGVSNCNGGCAATWPPYTSGATAEKDFPTNISVVTRSDGTKQFAWKGMPLYYYASDTKAGDILGDGIGGVWHIVKM